MDLGSLKKRLLQGRYNVRGGPEGFASDTRLVFDNGAHNPDFS